MRTSVINRFAKNDRAFSGRRRIAVLAATTVLAGGVQFIAADTGWACGDGVATAPVSQEVAQDNDFDLHGPGAKSAFISPTPATITIGGPKAEFGVEIANFSKADFHKAVAGFGLFNPSGATPKPSQVSVDVMDHGQWKHLTMAGGCDPAIHATGLESVAEPLTVGHARRYLFRVSISADAPKDVKELQVYGAGANFSGAMTTVKVVRQASAETTGPTAPAKPKPAPTKEARPAALAEPAADRTPAKATEPAKAPTATPSAAPATTAPAGTPELAHTGASSTNAFLATSSAVLLAIGGGVLLAVRRLRRQR
ncbi:LAETG motif-containing sortase-dependent surface protein [Kitasatospora sp. NPDC028055]|uniref:LAETG motif-containing sortase-dependent surface protein n=1 Tax=Kitasatospora sp. NPDC028055 TaxID=3155653 RepID=UPI0033C0B129